MSSRILTAVLATNAGFSAVTGVVMIVAAGPLSNWLGIPTWVTVGVGAGLVPFAVAVAATARSPVLSRVVQVIVADVSWVVGAAVITIGFPESMSRQGLWALGMVTVVVAVFAVLQTLGLRRREVGSEQHDTQHRAHLT